LGDSAGGMLRKGRIAIREDEINEVFVRAQGPGGQNVNRVATAVQLRFDLAGSPSLGEAVKRRAAVLAGSRLTVDGVIVIIAQRFRTQERNRQDARDRLLELLEEASHAPRPRIATRPTLASKRRRLEDKRHRAARKDGRKPGSGSD
jgi:ribosome-associated protein